MNVRLGDKQMLINSVRKIYRDWTGNVGRVQPVAKVATNRPAANANRFGNSEMQKRRLRRQRRLERTEHRCTHGWVVRTW